MKSTGEDTESRLQDYTVLLGPYGHLQGIAGEERRVQGAPECHKINLSGAEFPQHN